MGCVRVDSKGEVRFMSVASRVQTGLDLELFPYSPLKTTAKIRKPRSTQQVLRREVEQQFEVIHQRLEAPGGEEVGVGV